MGGEPVTRVDFRSDKNAEQWQCCTTVWLPIRLLSPHMIRQYSNQLPILFLPPDDIASCRVSQHQLRFLLYNAIQ